MRAVTLVFVVAGVLSACGDDDPSPGEQRAEQARAAAEEAGLESDVQEFLALAAQAVDATYQVTYEQTSDDGTLHIVVSQRPPDRRVDVVNPDGTTDSTLRIDDVTYQCSQRDETWTCAEDDSASETSPTGGFDAEAVAAITESLADRRDAYDFVVETREVAGVDATCLVTTLRADAPSDASFGESGTLCISPEGAPLLLEQRGARQEATAYTTDVPASAVELPVR